MRDSLRHKLADGRSIVEVLLEMEQNIGLLAAYAHQLEARIKWMETRDRLSNAAARLIPENPVSVPGRRCTDKIRSTNGGAGEKLQGDSERISTADSTGF